MNTLKKLIDIIRPKLERVGQSCRSAIVTIAAAAALLLLGGTAKAQDYKLLATLMVQGTTNAIATASATNLHVTANGTNGVTLTKYGDFLLAVDGFYAGALTNGFIDVVYSTSYNGTAWPTNDTFSPGPAAGWFSIPVNTGGSRILWNTNITVGSQAYWRINYLTNRTGLTVSNTTIACYGKQYRFGTK